MKAGSFYEILLERSLTACGLCGFRSLGSDFTMLLPGNEESHLCCFCMDSLSFGETQSTLAHTHGKHFSTGMLPDTDRKYVVVDSVHIIHIESEIISETQTLPLN